MSFTQKDAIELCVRVEEVCVKHGCHVALTGGQLYKEGERKDTDLLFYRHRQCAEIDMEGLWKSLAEIGLHHKSDHGFVHKASYRHIWSVDCLFPEAVGGYGEDDVDFAADLGLAP